MKFNIIVAVCENFGIGIKGDLPWRLKSELKYFAKTTKQAQDQAKKNAVIMGRNTYFGIPEARRPLAGRLNIVLSKTANQKDFPSNVLLFPTLESAMKRLEENDMKKEIENVWIIGGNRLYLEAMTSERCNRLYLTKIYSTFECDVFFPAIPNDFREVQKLDENLPQGLQEEDGIRYEYKIYEKSV